MCRRNQCYKLFSNYRFDNNRIFKLVEVMVTNVRTDNSLLRILQIYKYVFTYL